MNLKMKAQDNYLSQNSTSLEESFGSDNILQKHSLQQQIIDLNSKVRQLELTIIDVKASTDRKVSQLAEEVPSRL